MYLADHLPSRWPCALPLGPPDLEYQKRPQPGCRNCSCLGRLDDLLFVRAEPVEITADRRNPRSLQRRQLLCDVAIGVDDRGHIFENAPVNPA
jgi:hypothetical protein